VTASARRPASRRPTTTLGLVVAAGLAVAALAPAASLARDPGDGLVAQARAIDVPPARTLRPRSVVVAPYNPNTVRLTLSRIVGGLSQPVRVTNAGDGSGRLFIVEKPGRIRIHKNGTLLTTPFLDISSSVSKGSEQGLLGLAFHPAYETNGRFYINYTNSGGDTVIREYRRSSTNPDRANGSSGRTILVIDQPYSNHNGGNIAFGPDGYLYAGTGDGGSAGDPGNRAQSTSSMLGKMLRIDVDGTSGSRQYRIPSSNPYVGRTGLDEIWSRGLRNPWGWSFDRATGALWIGDVGQNRYEEINRSAATSSGAGRAANYGWRVMEARSCYSPSSGCNTSGKVLPITYYSHSFGCSVTGGNVYRGSAYPILHGGYFFGDYCSGRIWSISAAAASPASRVQHLDTSLLISSFGESESGELYLTDLGGSLQRLVGAPK